MENLLTSMSFWGIAAVAATTSRLIWEYVRASVRSEKKINKVSAISQQSLSFLDTHHKSFTIFLISALTVVALNIWVIPNAKPLTYFTVLAGGLMYAVASLLGYWINQNQIQNPHSFLAALFEGKDSRNVTHLLCGLGGFLLLIFYFQSTIEWTAEIVFNLFASYTLGVSSIALLYSVLPSHFQLTYFRFSKSRNLVSSDRTDALSGAVLATALLGTTFIDLQAFQKTFHGLGSILLPLVLAFGGVILSGVSGVAIRLWLRKDARQIVFAEKLATTLLMVITSYVLVRLCLPKTWVFGTQEYQAIQVFYAAQIGLICGLIISKLIHWYEMLEKVFLEYLYLKAYQVSFLDKAIHNGLRIFSAVVPLILLIAAFLLAYRWVGLYGVCIAIVAMQANLRTELSTEVAEMEKLILRSKKIFFHKN
jgi:K(+)-stimulated pyrophosphate-energized sodium pump